MGSDPQLTFFGVCSFSPGNILLESLQGCLDGNIRFGVCSWGNFFRGRYFSRGEFFTGEITRKHAREELCLEMFGGIFLGGNFSRGFA